MSSNNFFEFVFMSFDTYKNLFGSLVIRSVGEILLLYILASSTLLISEVSKSESNEIKKVVSDFIKRFGDKDGYINKQSDKVYGQTLEQLLGKVYQASKNLFDFKEEVKNDKGHIMPPSKWLSVSHPCHKSIYIGEEITGITYGQIMASIINKNLVEITGLTKDQLPSGSTDNWSYRQKLNAQRFSDYRG